MTAYPDSHYSLPDDDSVAKRLSYDAFTAWENRYGREANIENRTLEFMRFLRQEYYELWKEMDYRESREYLLSRSREENTAILDPQDSTHLKRDRMVAYKRFTESVKFSGSAPAEGLAFHAFLQKQEYAPLRLSEQEAIDYVQAIRRPQIIKQAYDNFSAHDSGKGSLTEKAARFRRSLQEQTGGALMMPQEQAESFLDGQRLQVQRRHIGKALAAGMVTGASLLSAFVVRSDEKKNPEPAQARADAMNEAPPRVWRERLSSGPSPHSQER